MQSKILTFLPGLCLALMGTAQAVVTTNGCSMVNVSCTLDELFLPGSFIVVDDKKFLNWELESDLLLGDDSLATGDLGATIITEDDSGPDPAIKWGHGALFGVNVLSFSSDPQSRVTTIRYDIEILDPNEAIKDNNLILHANSTELKTFASPGQTGSFTAEETVFALDDLITPITTKTVASGELTPPPPRTLIFH